MVVSHILVHSLADDSGPFLAIFLLPFCVPFGFGLGLLLLIYELARCELLAGAVTYV